MDDIPIFRNCKLSVQNIIILQIHIVSKFVVPISIFFFTANKYN